eukprot:Seg989.9 transcript_id=Seg989.9/GoldUCD/mRNA.D3Y31 product="Nucleoporin NUP35" protein_id=Seg989.9/GoldUCD/D3Y31
MSSTGFSMTSHGLESHFSPKASAGSAPMSMSPDLMHQHSVGGGGGSAYLPNYLLGGTASPSTTPQFGRSLSSTGFQGTSPQVHFASPHVQSADKRSAQKRISPLIQHRDKSSNAPPVEGLYDNTRCGIDEISKTNVWGATPTRATSTNLGSRSFNTPGSAVPHETSMNTSVFSPRQDVMPQSPAQLDPFYTQGETLTSNDILDETWVTIFGFPPSLVGYILEQFSQYGTIERKEISNNVNWIYVQFQTKLQAKKALSKNGKILNGNIMIGVCQCIDKHVQTCQDMIIGCCNEGCNVPVKRKERVEHSTVCPRETIHCSICHRVMERGQLEWHGENECIGRQIQHREIVNGIFTANWMIAATTLMNREGDFNLRSPIFTLAEMSWSICLSRRGEKHLASILFLEGDEIFVKYRLTILKRNEQHIINVGPSTFVHKKNESVVALLGNTLKDISRESSEVTIRFWVIKLRLERVL